MTVSLCRWRLMRVPMLIEAFTRPDSFTKKGNSPLVRSTISAPISSISHMPRASWNSRLVRTGSRSSHAQFVQQHSVGDDLLQGDSFSGQQFGLKLDLPVTKALLLTVAVTYAWGDANLRNPWSGYPGYTSVQVQDFNRAGEGAFLLRAGYDFPWVEGLSAYALGVFGTTPDLAGQYRQNEYDFNLQWAPKKGCSQGFVAASPLRARPPVWRECR